MDSFEFGLQMVWTKASTSQGIFRPVSALIETASVGGARMSVDLRASTGDLALLPALVHFNDPTASWPTPVLLPSGTPQWWTATQVHYMGEMQDLRTILAGSRFLLFGVLARNASGSARAIATVGGVVEWVGWSQ